MCGIVGIFLKDKNLESRLGELLTNMLITMTDRGPDSAGIAMYNKNKNINGKITIQSSNPTIDFENVEKGLKSKIKNEIKFIKKDTHLVINVDIKQHEKIRKVLNENFPSIRIMSMGENIEIYKEVGLAKEVSRRFSLKKTSGTHAIGHTRMATESAVTTMGAHPFSTTSDQCLVHNGSLSNHNSLRRKLTKEGIRIETLNDSEVAAAYLTYRMKTGCNLKQAMEESLNDLDGFFTFVIGTKNGFGVVRDPIACKPAVMAETKNYVAFGSEYRALATLPEIEHAKVWEPEPAKVYFWEH